MRAFADASNSVLGVVGMAQSARGFGRDRNETVLTAGFGAIALINMWRSWGLWREPPKGDK